MKINKKRSKWINKISFILKEVKISDIKNNLHFREQKVTEKLIKSNKKLKVYPNY